MDGRAIVDTGYLVALLNGNDAHHEWAAGLVPALRGPWVTAEACVSETIFLIEECGPAALDRLLSWLGRGLLLSQHALPERLDEVTAELRGYSGRWVDLADACIVCLSDESPNLPVASVDVSDFAVYFRQRRGRRLLLPASKASRGGRR